MDYKKLFENVANHLDNSIHREIEAGYSPTLQGLKLAKNIIIEEMVNLYKQEESK